MHSAMMMRCVGCGFHKKKVDYYLGMRAKGFTLYKTFTLHSIFEYDQTPACLLTILPFFILQLYHDEYGGVVCQSETD
jgi:hypothetical protein